MIVIINRNYNALDIDQENKLDIYTTKNYESVMIGDKNSSLFLL